jgi:ammonium transporter Rh
LGTFATSAYVKDKFTLEHILNASLAGGVVIGATAGLILQPGGSLAIGFLTGFISTMGFHKLTPYLEKKINLYDTCGVHNLHGIPGLLGGIISAIVAASYYYPSATDAYSLTNTEFTHYDTLVSTPFKQGGLQIAATFTSIGISIITSMICGFFLKFIYSFNEKELFTDRVYF